MLTAENSAGIDQQKVEVHPYQTIRHSRNTGVSTLIAKSHWTLRSGWWFGTCFFSPYIGDVIIPTDFHSIIFQRG